MVVDLEKTERPSTVASEESAPHQAAQEDSSDFTAADWALDKATVRRLDVSVVTLASIVYFLSFLDRSNIGNAKVAGMATDLKLTSHQYLIAITVTYVPYIISELPSNLLLKAVGPHIMIPSMVCLWGITCCLTGLVTSYSGLLAARFFLGMLEGGVFPGLVLYLSGFYRRHELQTRISLFFSAASLSGAFSGLLAAAIVKMDGVGGKQGWCWIFILEGLFTFLFAISLFWLLPATPQASRFLTAEQKAHVIRRLALDAPAGAGPEADKFSWNECLQAFKSPHVLLLAVALFGNGVTLYSFAYFTPTIVQTFKYSVVKTNLLTVPPFVCAFIVTMINAYLSDRFRMRGTGVIVMSVLALIGYCMFLTTNDKWTKYGSLFFSIVGVYGTAPALTTWLPSNVAPHYRRATAIAIGFIMTNSGGIASTWLFPASEGPEYRRGTIINLSFSIVTGLFAGLNLIYLVGANKRKQQRKLEASAAAWHVEGDRHPSFKYDY
ncbi:major facilitator superfamily domain-containing protein [Leucosporidium creatinivorum]|uniref:Major facilitator superfamily domain-containing protein n=1 Tax=Leucosporidium creatinivorum TaxID=106004 RepID=A0A1Y2FTV2_9BASI|nr:major facilitator superfamily domain-containing protein [Leucosporidium creatinivorum]